MRIRGPAVSTEETYGSPVLPGLADSPLGYKLSPATRVVLGLGLSRVLVEERL
jgi:hypothetical protein